MSLYKRMCRYLLVILFTFPLLSFASLTVESMVVFGDSMSDIGNTTHLLKTLRQEENPAFIVAPLKIFMINKMTEFADEYYVPQIVLDTGILTVTNFFDYDVAPYIVNLIAQVRLVPLLPGKPYWKSRFTNGKVWIEYLAEMLAIPQNDEDAYLNRAFGGSWASTYDDQLTVWNLIRHPINLIKALIVGKLVPPSLGLTVQAYLLEHQRLNDRTVYFIYSGGNDYLNSLRFEDKYDSRIMSLYIDNVIAGITSSIEKLAAAGARRFVVLGAPRVGNTPKFNNTTDKDILNAAVDVHNERLKARIDELKAIHPKGNFLFINTEPFLARALENPQDYGFTNATEACIDIKFPMFDAFSKSPFAGNYVLQYAQVLHYKDKRLASKERNYHICDEPENYIFWDEMHPSTRSHHYLAFDVCNELKLHGYKVTCKKPEFPSS